MILNSPEQIFAALSKGQPVMWCEEGSQDWATLNSQTQLSFSDLYTGFLQFKTEELPIFKLPIESAVYANQARFFVEFVHNLHGFEVYRVGKENFSYYAVRVNSNRPSTRNYFANLDIFRIGSTSGVLQSVDKLTLHASIKNGIERARSVKRSAQYNQVLESTGHFATEAYKNFKRKNRQAGVR
ncbi:hypothetical protein [Acinetobacter sp.]|uniref:hypothetical protein n=1 Tax=Acinetobacter sp. TaxID=472 RepID=UPI002899EFC3|nr:hypothetical protein [Acinetobacter sp.]